MSILFKNVTLLLKQENGTYLDYKNAYLGIDGKYIDYIGTTKPLKDYDTIKDYTNKLIMPGLVNAHTHSPMVFLRGLGAGLPLDKWLNESIFPTEAKLTKRHIEVSSYYAILELLASGVTSFTDMYFFPEETAKAVKDSGIKANLCKYINCFDDNAKLVDTQAYESLDFFKQYHKSCDDRLHVDFSIHAEYTNKAHIVKEYSEMCKENNGRMHVHISETRDEVINCLDKYGVSPVKWFEDLGTFENPTCAAHVVYPINDDLDILKKHNVSVIHNPTSNLYLGSGFAPVKEMLDMGINVALGTDGAASNNNLNMFEEMNLCSILFNGMHHDPLCLQDEDAISMATVNGYKLQGRDDVGLIEIGKRADIIAIDLNSLHLYPILDYPAIVTKSAQASDVCMTMVDGNILYENGEYLTLDKDKIIFEFKQEVEKFFN